MKRKILVVDDEANIQELITFNLQKNGYDTVSVRDGSKVIEVFNKERPDLVILDIMLPGVDGLELCKKIRGMSKVPIIMVSAKIEEFDKILALELGADDYITKPFSVRELLARVKSVLRRYEEFPLDKSADQIVFGRFKIIPGMYKAMKDDQELTLTLTEYKLLEILLKSPGRVLSREFLIEYIWGIDFFGDTRTIDVHIRHLREKIEDDSSRPEYIITVRGVGYKFKEKE